MKTLFFLNLNINSQEKNVHGHTKSFFGILEVPVYVTLVTDLFYRNTHDSNFKKHLCQAGSQQST